PASVWGQQENLVARIAEIEQFASALVEQIGVDAVRTQQAQPPLPDRPLALELVEVGLHRGKLLVEIGLRAQTVVAGEGIEGKVPDEQRRERIKRNRGQDGAAAMMTDHGRTNCAAPVKAALTPRSGALADLVEHEVADALAAVAQYLEHALVDEIGEQDGV